jgi:hypothetical protein
MKFVKYTSVQMDSDIFAEKLKSWNVVSMFIIMKFVSTIWQTDKCQWGHRAIFCTLVRCVIFIYKINVREYRRDNQKLIIQRNWKHRVHKTAKSKTKTEHNMCWTSLYTNNVNKTIGGKDEPNIIFVFFCRE